MGKILFYCILILIWALAYKIGVEWIGFWEPYTFPSPWAVFGTLWALIKDNTLGTAVLASMKRILIGFSFSVLLGTVIGLVIVRFRYLDENMRALILGLQTLPSICWLPFAILWFGLNESAILFVITIGSTFAIAIAVESSIKNVNPLYIKAARTMGASGGIIYWNVILPASLPGVLAGLKQGWSFAWRALMAGEMLTAAKGLGQVLVVGRDLADISQVMAVMLVIVALGLTIDKLVFGWIEKDLRYKWGLERSEIS